MGNVTWVCFDCRRSDRSPAWGPEAAACAQCHGPMRCIGYKIRIPAKAAKAAWERLWKQITEKAIAVDRTRRQSYARDRHALEREIAALEAKPKNRERAREIKRLQTSLNALIRENSG